jgi:glycosyltransferase involved in cell wall biosynthesis
LAPAIAEARVIPNGVDLTNFRPGGRLAARERLQLPSEAYIILFAANDIRNNDWKDYHTLRAAVMIAAEMCPERRLLFLGLGDDGPQESDGPVEMRFVPYQNDLFTVAQFYQAADVYVHAARAETFPISILEAMASGLPIVATAVGGVPEQINDGETGLLAAAGDAASLARAIARLVQDDALSGRLGAGAAVTARERFDLQRQVDAYLDWYRELRQHHALGYAHVRERPERAFSSTRRSSTSASR